MPGFVGAPIWSFADHRKNTPTSPAVAKGIKTDEDLLPLWHWLTDPDAAVARVALDALVAHAGRPAGWTPPTDRPGPADRDAFRAHLDDRW